jgi:hypothetical protein
MVPMKLVTRLHALHALSGFAGTGTQSDVEIPQNFKYDAFKALIEAFTAKDGTSPHIESRHHHASRADGHASRADGHASRADGHASRADGHASRADGHASSVGRALDTRSLTADSCKPAGSVNVPVYV